MIDVWMYPDYDDWEADDLRWKAGYFNGLHMEFGSGEKVLAVEAYNNAYELGFTVSMVFD